MKLLTIPNSILEIENTIEYIDGVIIGIKSFSVNTNLNIETKDIPKIITILKGKELFISINKNIINSEIDKIKQIMNELNHYPITGVLYADTGILNIHNSNKYNYDLVYAHEHFTTNYSTINFWKKHGIKGVYISNDITSEEIDKIINNTNLKTMTILFGYLPMYVSFRHAVNNYINQFNLNNPSKLNYIYKEDKYYPIIDTNEGTVVYSSDILNAIEEYINLNLTYGIINSLLLNTILILEILKIFKNTTESNLNKSKEKLNKLIPNISRGFMEQKTIYRVKKNDK